MQSNSQKAIKGISSQAIVTIVLGLVEIASFAIMSRLLSKEDFGLFASVMAVVAVFSSFTEAGIGSAVVQRKDIDSRYVNNAFTICLLFGLFVSIIEVILAGPISKAVLSDRLRDPLMLMSITLFVNCLTSVNIGLLQRELRFLTIGVIQVVSVIISTIIAIVLAFRGMGYYAIVIKAIATPILVYCISFYYIKTRFHICLDKENFKAIFGFSGWFMASRLLRNLSKQIDRLLMPRLMSVEMLGAYTRPKEFIDQISTKLNGVFDTVLFPVLSSIQDNKYKLASSLEKSVYYLNLFSTIITFAFAFNSRLLIHIFFGEAWLSLSTVFSVLSIAVLFNADGRLADCYLRSLGKTKEQFLFRILELGFKVGSIVIGVQWGLLGVAIAVVFSESLVRLVKLFYVSKKVDLPPITITKWIFSSWRVCLFLLPINIFAYVITPNSLGGEIMMALIFIFSIFVAFLLKPIIVGNRYKQEVYPKVKDIMKDIHILNSFYK